MVRIHHVASAADWRAARRSGSYTTSTRGLSLAEQGFIHAARPEQVAGVHRRFYADATEPLVLLTIETDLLDVPWREEPVGDDTFPHVYGALSPAAVVAVQPLDAHGRTPSFTTLFVAEAARRVGVALLAMVLAVAMGSAAGAVWGSSASLPGAVVGLVVGGTVGWLVVRRARWR